MNTLKEIEGIQFQMIINHFSNRDELILRVAGHELLPDSKIVDRILESFKNEKPVYADILAKKLIHPLKIEIVGMQQLEFNQRTGKLKRVIDSRIGKS